MEGLMGSLLGAGNRTRKAVKGLFADPASVILDRLAVINENAREFNKGSKDDFDTLMYRGVMRDDPSYLAARDAAEKREQERWIDFVGGGVGSVGKAATTKSAKTVVEDAFGKAIPQRSKTRVGTTGQYVGAPPGVDSPAKMGAIVKEYQDFMETGIPGRYFYRDSSGDIWARTGHNPDEADLFAQNLALLSRSNNVGGNTTMSVKGHLQAVTGEPVQTGRFPSRDSPPLQGMYDAGRVEYLGHKRDPFATQLGVAWAPERIGRGVNDMHEAQIMGYPPVIKIDPKTGVETRKYVVGGDTQHAFMDDVRQRAIRHANAKALGGFSDWDTGTAQAAAWTGNKIRRGEVTPGEGAKSYADYLPRHEANAPYEAVSAESVGHLRGLLDAPWEVKQEYTSDPRGLWNTSKSGRDIGYTAARMLPGPTTEVPGRFMQGTAPARVTRPLAGTVVLPDKSYALTEGSKKAMSAVEAARGYFDAQEASTWHKLMPTKEPNYDGAFIDFGRNIDRSDMEKVAPLFEKKGYYLANSPGGLTVIANERTKKGGDFSKEVRDLIKGNKDAFAGARAEFGRLEKPNAEGIIDYSKQWGEGKGAVTTKMLEYIDAAPEVAKNLESSQAYRDAVLGRNARDIEYQAKGYGVAREDVMRAREIFAKEGWEGLRRAAKAGIVPAVLLTAFAPGLLGGISDQKGD